MALELPLLPFPIPVALVGDLRPRLRVPLVLAALDESVASSMIVKPPRELTHQFRVMAMERRRPVPFLNDEPACWLASFDPYERPCSNDRKWEAFHFFGKQEIRNHPPLFGLTGLEFVELEWDPRNGGPGCQVHHRSFDHQDGRPKALIVPRSALPGDVEEFVDERGLESLAEARFG